MDLLDLFAQQEGFVADFVDLAGLVLQQEGSVVDLGVD